MNDKKKEPVEVSEEVQRLSVSEWIEKYQNVLFYTLLGILIVVVGILAVRNYVIKPKALSLSDANARAIVYFAQGDYERALKGDEGDCEGFLEIAEGNHFYQEGKLAALYAGICYYKVGQYDDAIPYLEVFSSKDLNIAPLAKQFLGDAYVQTEQYDKAVKAFKDAAESKNAVIAPVSLKKAGLVYLNQEDKVSARKCFETIKKDYPSSREAQDITKYIALTE